MVVRRISSTISSERNTIRVFVLHLGICRSLSTSVALLSNRFSIRFTLTRVKKTDPLLLTVAGDSGVAVVPPTSTWDKTPIDTLPW